MVVIWLLAFTNWGKNAQSKTTTLKENKNWAKTPGVIDFLNRFIDANVEKIDGNSGSPSNIPALLAEV